MLSLYCGDARVAEDLAQEALAQACLEWERVRGMSSPQGWVRRVALNQGASWFRRKAAERRAYTRSHDSAQVPEPNPETVVVRDAIAGLPPRQRAVVVLRFYEGLSVAEVAEVLGCAAGTVKAHTHKALASLRPLLEESEESNERA